jgi:hypothetical protein
LAIVLIATREPGLAIALLVLCDVADPKQQLFHEHRSLSLLTKDSNKRHVWVIH